MSSRFIALSLLIFCIGFGESRAAAAADKKAIRETNVSSHFKNNDDYISSQVRIEAPVDVVWKMVRTERSTAPNLVYSKLRSEEKDLMVFEEKWTVVPFLKTSECIVVEKSVPNKRIDYKLTHSDRFKAMEGSWIFTPSADGLSTNLELTAHIELRGITPDGVAKLIAKKRMEQRLEHVKTLSEKPHADLDVGGRVVDALSAHPGVPWPDKNSANK